MNLMKNIVNDIQVSNNNCITHSAIEKQLNNSNFEYKLNYLKMESEIPLYKAKLLILEEQSRILVENQELALKVKEKQMDKIIKKTKELLLDVIHFIFTSPLKEKEFIVNNNNGLITFNGNLGHLFKYFLSQYNIDIETISKKLRENNQEILVFNKDTSEQYFLEIFNKNYFMPTQDDSLI